MESHKEIEDRAAAWLAKRDSGDWSEDDQVDFLRWIDQSIAHRVSVLRLEVAWEEARRLKALGAGREPGIVPSPGAWRHTPFFEMSEPPQSTPIADMSNQSSGSKGRIEHDTDVESPANEAKNSALSVQGPRHPPSDLRHLTAPVISADLLNKAKSSRGAARKPRAEESLAGRRMRKIRARGRWLYGLAGSLMLAVGLGGYLIFMTSPGRYSTPVGGITSFALRDGSNITLNTASNLRVSLMQNERRIDLQEGEAFFEVAKDTHRPFVVRVGDKRVIAVGTKFSVRREGDDIEIVVVEGTVRLESASLPLVVSKELVTDGTLSDAGVKTPAANADSSMAKSTSLTAGTIARATGEDVLIEKSTIPHAEEILSWRRGYLTFHETTLSDAVAEFNRYNSHPIAIDDQNVADIRISGTFRPTNYEAFVRLLQEGFSIHVKEDGDRTILTKN